MQFGGEVWAIFCLPISCNCFFNLTQYMMSQLCASSCNQATYKLYGNDSALAFALAYSCHLLTCQALSKNWKVAVYAKPIILQISLCTCISLRKEHTLAFVFSTTTTMWARCSCGNSILTDLILLQFNRKPNMVIGMHFESHLLQFSFQGFDNFGDCLWQNVMNKESRLAGSGKYHWRLPQRVNRCSL